MFTCHSCKDDFAWSEGRMWTCFCVFCVDCMKDAQAEFAANEKVFSCVRCNKPFDEACGVLEVGEPVSVSATNIAAVLTRFSEWTSNLENGAMQMLDIYNRRTSYPEAVRQVIEDMVSVEATHERIEVAERWKNAFINLLKAPEAPNVAEAMVSLGRMLPTIPITINLFDITEIQQDVWKIKFADVINACYGLEEWDITIEVNNKSTVFRSGRHRTENEYDVKIYISPEDITFVTFTHKSEATMVQYALPKMRHKYNIFGHRYQSLSTSLQRDKNFLMVTPEIGYQMSLNIPDGTMVYLHIHRGLCFLTKTHVFRYTITEAGLGMIEKVAHPFVWKRDDTSKFFVTDDIFLMIEPRTLTYYRIPAWETVATKLEVFQFNAQ